MLKVAIVEDNEIIRKRLAMRLEGLPSTEVVGTYSNAEEAFEGLQRTQPTLTILDIGLPQDSGLELLAQLVELDYPGDFIMFTVLDRDEYLFRALELGAIGYVLKEDRVAGVQRAIEDYREGGSPMSPTIARRVLKSFTTREQKGDSHIELLTKKQELILRLTSDGLLNKEIGERLGVTEGTIKQHLYRIYRKLSVNNRTEAVRLFLRAKT